jgi:hypothetical protein
MTPGLSVDRAMFPHEYKNLHDTRKLQMSKQNEQKEREKYIQSDQPA